MVNDRATPGARVRTFYRIVRTARPTLRDFTSNSALGRPPPVHADAELRRLWDGVSVQATVIQARNRARRMPVLGQHIARLDLPTDGTIKWEKTLGPGHHTVWAEPAVLI